jgi:probable rRNA maturation factor
MTDDPGSSYPPVHSEPAVTIRTAKRRSQPGNVEIYVADEQDAVVIDTTRWMQLAAHVLADEAIEGVNGGDVEMSLLFVDETTIAQLNEQHMGKQGPTDVLSFPIDAIVGASTGRFPDNSASGPTSDPFADEDDDDMPTMLGDVLICPTVAARNAPEHESDHHDGSVDDELALLVVHGILHLIGHDHVIDAEAEVMEAREQVLLGQHHRGTSAGSASVKDVNS